MPALTLERVAGTRLVVHMRLRPVDRTLFQDLSDIGCVNVPAGHAALGMSRIVQYNAVTMKVPVVVAIANAGPFDQEGADQHQYDNNDQKDPGCRKFHRHNDKSKRLITLEYVFPDLLLTHVEIG